jgi:hypothetical protein
MGDVDFLADGLGVERFCFMCGCTEGRACMDESGACFWVGENWCSACCRQTPVLFLVALSMRAQNGEFTQREMVHIGVQVLGPELMTLSAGVLSA